MKRALLTIFAASAIYALANAKGKDKREMKVAPSVDLSRYAGRWYEIARLPNRFENKCAGEVTATYRVVEGDKLSVVNECRRADGKSSRAGGIARTADKNGPNSKLEVRFAPSWLAWLPQVWGDYWVTELAEDYSYSVVGSPDRKYLWILSRAPKMDEAVYRRLVHNASAQGFDVARLIKTRQGD